MEVGWGEMFILGYEFFMVRMSSLGFFSLRESAVNFRCEACKGADACFANFDDSFCVRLVNLFKINDGDLLVIYCRKHCCIHIYGLSYYYRIR